MNDDSDSDTEIASEEDQLNKSFGQIKMKSPPPSSSKEKFRPPTRGGHSTVFFPNVQQLICFGGSNEKNTNNEIYCLSLSGQWTDCTKYQAGEIPSPRYAHTCVFYKETMIIFGGLDNNTYFSDMYYMTPKMEPCEFMWKKIIPKGETPCGRYGHTLNVVGDKFVLFGGFGAERRAFNDLWLYDPKQNVWSKPTLNGNPPESRYYHTTCVINNNLVVYGGKKANIYFNDVHILNTYTKNWMKVELKNPFNNIPIPPRAYHSAAVIGEKGQYICVLGGFDGNNLFKDIQILDMEEMLWFECDIMNNVRCKHTANAISDDVILVFGGHDGTKFLNDTRDISNNIAKINIKKMNKPKRNSGGEKENTDNVQNVNKNNSKPVKLGNLMAKTARDEVIEFSSMLEQITKPTILKTLPIDDLENFEFILQEALQSIQKIKNRKKEVKSKKIQFGEVQVREYPRVVDGGGTVPDDNGPTLGLDWRSVKVLRRRLSSFENIRMDLRVDRESYMQKGYIPPSRRANILTKNGATPEVMNHNVMKNQEIKKNRKETVNCSQGIQISGLPVNPF